MELNGYVYNKDRSAKSKVVMKDSILVKMKAHTMYGECKFKAEVQKAMASLKEAASSSQSSLVTTCFTRNFSITTFGRMSFDEIRRNSRKRSIDETVNSQMVRRQNGQ